MYENCTTVTCISNFDTSKSLKCDSPAENILDWAFKFDTWLLATDLLGILSFTQARKAQ